jgi:hypothetical protein
MKKHLILGKTVIFIIAIFITVQSFGQRERDNLFNVTTRAEIGFTSEQSNKLDRMIANPNYSNHFFVKVNNLSDVINGKALKVNLPDKQNIEVFYTKNTEYKSNNEFTYFGDFDPCGDDRMGYIHLIAKGGDVFGQINIEEEIYELQDFGGNKNVLFKINPSIYTEDECASTHEADGYQGINQNEELNINFRSGGCNVRVLVLFTAAADAIGDPPNSATLFMQQTNQIINNSEATLHFTLAGVEELVGFIETPPAGIGAAAAITDTRNRLRINAAANALRDTHQADLVVLLTDGNWGGIVGVSFLNEWGDPDFGYVVAEIDAAGGRFTFTHELAHDFGCKHNDDDAGPPQFVFEARGRSFLAPWYWPTRRKTTMAQLEEGGTRIMHFSNPEVEFRGINTGLTDRNNAHQLTNMGCEISDYRSFTPPTPFSIDISGPVKGTNLGTYTWCVNIQGCQSTPSILWEYSIDGIHFNPWFTNQYCITAPMPMDASLWLRVTVTCGSQVITVWHFTENSDGDPCDQNQMAQLSYVGTNTTNFKNTLNENSFHCFPNPVSNSLNLQFSVHNDETKVEIQLIDITGKFIHQFVNDKFQIGSFTKNIDISSIQSGYYFIKTKIGSELITKSIVKL